MSTRSFVFSFIFIGIMASLISSSCRSSKKATKIKAEDFSTFYEKFHDDLTFQKSRVSFPISGYHMKNGKKVDWDAKNWMFQKGKITDIKDKKYQVTRKVDNSKVYEKLIIPNSDFLFERTFELKDGKWYLISCTDWTL